MSSRKFRSSRLKSDLKREDYVIEDHLTAAPEELSFELKMKAKTAGFDCTSCGASFGI